MRTQRLTDAGRDLAYLYFYKNHPKSAARLEGVATFDPRYQPDYGTALDQTKTGQPAASIVLELQSARGALYTTSGADGWFAFDGLAPGDYKLTPFARGFPDKVQRLAAPLTFRVSAKGCVNEVVLIPRAGP
jgi:hypothetical protein